MQANGNPTCFGFVQTYDTKPKRRLFEVLTGHGMAPNQQVTFLTDGGEDIRDLPRMLNPQAEHLLDWFHTVSYTHLRAHETRHDLVCRLLLEKKKKIKKNIQQS